MRSDTAFDSGRQQNNRKIAEDPILGPVLYAEQLMAVTVPECDGL
jgi:hypothetical protein